MLFAGGDLLHEVDDYETMARHVIQLLRDPSQRAKHAALGMEWTQANCDPIVYRTRFVEQLAKFVDDTR